jgi:hypothetical protein
MPDYSLVPVVHQPHFDDYSLVPVDHDPFAEDGPAQLAHNRPSRNSLRREPVSPASTGRRPATAPADRVAALASSALAAPKVATFRAAMRGSDSRARRARGMLLLRK